MGGLACAQVGVARGVDLALVVDERTGTHEGTVDAEAAAQVEQAQRRIEVDAGTAEVVGSLYVAGLVAARSYRQGQGAGRDAGALHLVALLVVEVYLHPLGQLEHVGHFDKVVFESDLVAGVEEFVYRRVGVFAVDVDITLERDAGQLQRADKGHGVGQVVVDGAFAVGGHHGNRYAAYEGRGHHGLAAHVERGQAVGGGIIVDAAVGHLNVVGFAYEGVADANDATDLGIDGATLHEGHLVELHGAHGGQVGTGGGVGARHADEGEFHAATAVGLAHGLVGHALTVAVEPDVIGLDQVEREHAAATCGHDAEACSGAAGVVVLHVAHADQRAHGNRGADDLRETGVVVDILVGQVGQSGGAGAYLDHVDEAVDGAMLADQCVARIEIVGAGGVGFLHHGGILFGLGHGGALRVGDVAGFLVGKDRGGQCHSKQQQQAAEQGIIEILFHGLLFSCYLMNVFFPLTI